MATRCERLDTGRCGHLTQGVRDLIYGLIVVLCFVLGVGAIVGSMTLIEPLLRTLS